jgi:hypothetical protein
MLFPEYIHIIRLMPSGGQWFTSPKSGRDLHRPRATNSAHSSGLGHRGGDDFNHHAMGYVMTTITDPVH